MKAKEIITEEAVIALDEIEYYMEEGCGLFAVALALNSPGAEIYVISNNYGESWSRAFPYELTHVFTKIPNDGFYDIKGKRSPIEMANDFGLQQGDYSLRGPFEPKQFYTRFMGNSDSKPLYGSVRDIKQLQKHLQSIQPEQQ